MAPPTPHHSPAAPASLLARAFGRRPTQTPLAPTGLAQALRAAIALGDDERARSLLAHGACPFARPVQVLGSAFSEAAAQGRADWLRTFARVGLGASQADLDAALSRAVEASRADTVAPLVELGADVELRALGSGCNALEIALAMSGNRAVVDALLSAGANANGIDPTRREIPLGIAARGNALAFIDALLQAGADPNARGLGGLSPLDTAAGENHPEIAARLIAAGAQVQARDGRGFAPLHTAAMAGAGETVDTLLAAGASPSLLDGQGRTAGQLLLERLEATPPKGPQVKRLASLARRLIALAEREALASVVQIETASPALALAAANPAPAVSGAARKSHRL